MDPRFKVEDSRRKIRAVRRHLPTEGHRRRENDHMLCFFLRCVFSIPFLPDKNKPDSWNARSGNGLCGMSCFGNRPRKRRVYIELILTVFIELI